MKDPRLSDLELLRLEKNLCLVEASFWPFTSKEDEQLEKLRARDSLFLISRFLLNRADEAMSMFNCFLVCCDMVKTVGRKKRLGFCWAVFMTSVVMLP